MSCMILVSLMHPFLSKKQKARDYLVMLTHVILAIPEAEIGRTLGAFSLKEEKRD